MGNRFFKFLSKCTENFGKLTYKNSNENASSQKVQIESDEKNPSNNLDTVFKNNFELIVNDDNYFSKDENLYYEKRFQPPKYKENQTIRYFKIFPFHTFIFIHLNSYLFILLHANKFI